MNLILMAVSYLAGAGTVILVGVQRINSLFDSITSFLNGLFGFS